MEEAHDIIEFVLYLINFVSIVSLPLRVYNTLLCVSYERFPIIFFWRGGVYFKCLVSLLLPPYSLKETVADCNIDVEVRKLFNALLALFAHICSSNVEYSLISVPISVNFYEVFTCFDSLQNNLQPV